MSSSAALGRTTLLETQIDDEPELSLTALPEIWHVAVVGGAGYLPDGTEAKVPAHFALGIPTLMDLNHHQFAEPRAFALRVACMLKFYNVLTFDLSRVFGEVMDVVMGSRFESIMQVDEELGFKIHPSNTILFSI